MYAPANRALALEQNALEQLRCARVAEDPCNDVDAGYWALEEKRTEIVWHARITFAIKSRSVAACWLCDEACQNSTKLAERRLARSHSRSKGEPGARVQPSQAHNPRRAALSIERVAPGGVRPATPTVMSEQSNEANRWKNAGMIKIFCTRDAARRRSRMDAVVPIPFSP